MKKVFKRRFWTQVLAVVLALSLNLGVADGLIRYAVSGTVLADFKGFLQYSEAGEGQGGKKLQPQKNKNKLPESAGPKQYKNSKEEEAKYNNEVKSKRSVYSKTFKTGASEYRTEVYPEPVHFYNEKNELTDIDNTLVESKEKGFAFENRANAFKVRFSDKAKDKNLVQAGQRDFSITWSLADGQEADGQEADGNPAKNTITYRGISKDTDLRYILESSKLKEEIILNSPDTESEFKFNINLKNLDYKIQSDGSINFVDRTGSILWTMPKPFMFDAEGVISQAVTAKIGREQGRLLLTVKADREWLQNPGRQFPVVIDPILQPGERLGRDTFISSAYSDTSFDADSHVRVGNTPDYGNTIGFFFFKDIIREENAKITDAKFSLYSQAGSLSSVKLQEVLVDWVWDYGVLTWDYWQGRIDRGHEVLGSFNTTEGGSASGWWNFDVTELVQKWVDNPVGNTGFALLPDGSGYKKFVASNYGTNDREWSYHPKLVYTYTTEAPETKPAQFTMQVDRKNGSIIVKGTAKKDAKIYLSTSDQKKFTTNADGSGKWEIKGLNFEDGKIKSVSMYYTYQVQVTDAEGNTHTETRTSETTSQKFLITRYSKGARMAKMAKLYYYDGAKTDWLKEVNGIEEEFEMVVGDWVLVPDPREDRAFTGGEIITDPDEEYKLREKLRPVYSNGEVIGDSIDAATGNFFVIETDLAFDAPGLPIEFTRIMNAQEPENYRGSFGQNWHFGYEKMLVKYSDGTILATGGDGGGYFFRPSGSGYVSDQDVTDKLVKNGDDTYSIVTKYNTVYHFNQDGVLDRITDRNNNSVTLTYDNEGLLRTVSDAADRTCRLSYDYMGRITMIEDPEGRQVEYDYDSWGRLRDVIDLNGGMTKYDYGTYTPTSFSDTMKITKITDPMGLEIVRNTYDEQGRVIAQTDAEDYDISLEYSGSATTLTDKNNNRFVYNFDDEYRVTSIEGPAVETGVPESASAPVQALKFGSRQDGPVINPEVRVAALSYTTAALNDGVTASSDASAGLSDGSTASSDVPALTDTSANLSDAPAVTSASGSTRVLAQYHYDSNGYRDQLKDAAGHTMYFEYNSQGNLLSALNSEDKGTWYEYNDSDNRNYPTDIYDALENKTHIAYDDRGNTRSVTNAKDETTYYTYKNNGLVETVTDPENKQVRYDYYTDGNVKYFEDGRGNETYYYYDDISRLTEVKDPKGNRTYYEYDDSGNLLREYAYIGGELTETVNSYDGSNNLIGTEDPEGNVTLYQYNKRGDLEREISPLTNTTRTEYDGNGNRLRSWDGENNLTEYRYDKLGWLREVVEPSDDNPDGDITRYYYDANGNRVGVREPGESEEKLTVYGYDQFDRLETITDADKRTAQYSYDDLGNVLHYRDFDNTYTDYLYDQLSRVQETTVNDQQRTAYTYDRSGNIKTVTNPLNQTYIYRYDDNNNLWQVEDPEHHITEFGYDSNNNRETVKDPLGNVTFYRYDELNRLYEIADSLNRTSKFELNGSGQRVAVTDGNKNTTRYEYDADGRLEFVYDAKTNKTEYKYDRDGNLRFFWDANRKMTEYRYNSKNLVTQVIDPLKRVTEFKYDENGNLKSKKDPNGITIEYDYDNLNRLLGVYYPDESYVEYGYNDQGKREWMEDQYGTTWYDYDDLGRLTAVTNPDERTIEYGYNDLGQKTLVRYPDAKEVTYTYDNLNRLKSIKDRVDKITAYEYDKSGRRTKTVLPNGVTTSYGYDNANQLKVIESVNAAGKVLGKYEYDYDNNGNRKTFNQTVDGALYTTQYNYDPLNELDQVINPDGSRVGYKYDPAGNRLEMKRVEGDSTTTTKYEYNEANELTRLSGDDGTFTEFRYDKNGNRIAKIEPDNVVTNYTWDYENRLTEVRFHQGKRVGFEYDGDGNRITKMSAMQLPTYKNNEGAGNKGKGNDPGFTPPGQNKAKKQQADLQYMLLSKGGRSGGSSGGGGGSNSGSNGNGKNDKANNGIGQDKDKAARTNEKKVNNKDLKKEDREKKKDQAKAKKGYRQKGKYNNKGKHLGWYKNGKIPGEQTGEHVDITYYLNDVSDPLTQVMMTYGADGNYDAAYTYGMERIEVEDLDETRPESQDPLYYLYDGLGSVTYMVKPDGNIRDHYNFDEYGKPAPGNSKQSPDGAINLNNTFGYTGEMWDEESNLLYLRARYYEPETGRFLSRDTYEGEMANPLSKNLYSYVQNNPVNFTDPTGHHRQKFILNAINQNHAVIVKLGAQFNKTQDPTMRALLNIQADELRIQNLQMLYWTSGSEGEQAKLQAQINGIRHDHGWGWSDTQYFTPDGPAPRGNHRVTKMEVAKWRPRITKGTGNLVGMGIDTKSQPPKDTGYKPPKNPDQGKQRVRAPGGRGETGWLDKSGNVWVPDLDMDGGEGWRRHYPDGSHDHVYPGGKVRTHDADLTAGDVAKGAVVVGGGYLMYRGARMLPSLLPPLWPTIPANVAIP